MLIQTTSFNDRRMLVTYLTLLFVVIARGDDSLKGALHAVRKRSENYVTPVFYSRPHLYDSDGQPEDIGYGYQKIGQDMGFFGPAPLPYNELGSPDVDDRNEAAVMKLISDYLKDSKPHLKHKQKKTVFREREPTEAIERIFDSPHSQSQSTSKPSLFRERFGKYRALLRAYGGNPADSGVYAVNGGQSGRRGDDDDLDDEYLAMLNQLMEKYSPDEDPEYLSQEDIEEILDYLNSKDEKKRQLDNYGSSYDFFNSPMTWSKRSKMMEHKRFGENLFDERYSYKDFQKRFPIAKRSPSYIPVHLERQKKSDKKTDPKVQAVLSDIFDSEKTGGNNVTTTTSTTSLKVDHKPVDVGQKEQTIDAAVGKPLTEPRGIQKKSIKWSDYFGLDRKKKTADWLVDKYLRQQQTVPAGVEKKRSTPDDIDSKMRAMEDIIVDEAIKYTGSHEGLRDTQEIQQVKDKVMSQLAAAYSLEKMRRALGEFKASIAAQQASAPSTIQPSSIPAGTEINNAKLLEKKEKPEPNDLEKKQSHDASNNILVNYIEQNDDDNCPVLEEVSRRCRDITKLVGQGQNKYLINLCNFHQVCYLCGPQLRAASPHECDAAFAMEAESNCQGDPECLYEARRTLHAIRYAKPLDRTCNWRANRCLARFLSRVVTH